MSERQSIIKVGDLVKLSDVQAPTDKQLAAELELAFRRGAVSEDPEYQLAHGLENKMVAALLADDHEGLKTLLGTAYAEMSNLPKWAAVLVIKELLLRVQQKVKKNKVPATAVIFNEKLLSVLDR